MGERGVTRAEPQTASALTAFSPSFLRCMCCNSLEQNAKKKREGNETKKLRYVEDHTNTHAHLFICCYSNSLQEGRLTKPVTTFSELLRRETQTEASLQRLNLC